MIVARDVAAGVSDVVASAYADAAIAVLVNAVIAAAIVADC